MGNKFLNDIPWLTKEKKEKFKRLKGSANSKVDLNKMRDESKEYHDSIIPFHYKDVESQSVDIKDNITWLTEEEVFEGLEDITNSEVDLNKIKNELKDPHKDGEVRQDQLEYLKLKYLCDDEPIEYLDVRVPFHYKDVKYQYMDMKDYIAMVEEIERREELEVLEILKKRNIID